MNRIHEFIHSPPLNDSIEDRKIFYSFRRPSQYSDVLWKIWGRLLKPTKKNIIRIKGNNK